MEKILEVAELRKEEKTKIMLDRKVLAAMKEITEVYNGSGVDAARMKYEEFLSKKVDFHFSWQSFRRCLADNWTIMDDKLCYDGNEILSLEDYYLRASQMVGEKIKGALTGRNIKTLQTKMNEKYWMNAGLLIEGLFPSKSSSDIPSPNVEQLAGAGGGGGNNGGVVGKLNNIHINPKAAIAHLTF